MISFVICSVVRMLGGEKRVDKKIPWIAIKYSPVRFAVNNLVIARCALYFKLVFCVILSI